MFEIYLRFSGCENRGSPNHIAAAVREYFWRNSRANERSRGDKNVGVPPHMHKDFATGTVSFVFTAPHQPKCAPRCAAAATRGLPAVERNMPSDTCGLRDAPNMWPSLHWSGRALHKPARQGTWTAISQNYTTIYLPISALIENENPKQKQISPQMYQRHFSSYRKKTGVSAPYLYHWESLRN